MCYIWTERRVDGVSKRDVLTCLSLLLGGSMVPGQYSL